MNANPKQPRDETKITSNVHLVSGVLRSGRFQVPWHQRHYDWKTEQVRDLLEDLRDARDAGKTCYFLGSIMLLKSTGTMPRRINDGQQRLITLSLLMAAFCRRFAKQSSPDTAREHLALCALFDRPEHPPSRLVEASRYEPRIEPPKHDKSRYSQLLRGHDIGTNGLLTAAWNTVDEFVGALSAEARSDFFDFLMDSVEISVLDIPDDVDANLVFETLNARGKRLNDVDLIRNRLYSFFPESEDATRRNTVRDNLEQPQVILRSRPRVPEYFRCFLQCSYGFLQKKRFYRDARTQIERKAGQEQPSDYVYDLVVGLGRPESIELFRTIGSANPSEVLEGRLPRISGKRSLTVLLGELQGYKVSHPLCFALLHRFIGVRGTAERRRVGSAVARSLKNLASFVMRSAFVTSTFRPSRFEEGLANAATTVFAGDDTGSLDIMESLEDCDAFGVMDDSSFVRRMTDMELLSDNRASNQKALRYLFGINAQEQRGSDALQRDGCSVEHVLPQSDSHWEGWRGFGDVNPRDWVYRIGNLVVVSKRENRGGEDFNASFAAKKRALAESPLQMARKLVEDYDEWTPEAIARRSKELAEAAARVWAFRRGR